MKFAPLKFSIRQQLLGLFGLMLATGASVLVLDTVNERAAVATMTGLRDDSLAGLRSVKAVSDAYGLDVVDTTFRVRNKLMGWEQGIEVLDRAASRIQLQWDVLIKTRQTAEQKNLVDDIRHQRETADRAAAKLRAILKSKDAPALASFADTELYPAIDPVITRLQFLSDLQMITARGNLDADARRVNLISVWRIALSLLAFVVVLAVGRRILRHIYRGVEKLVQLANATRGGDYTTPVGELPRGELGQVAKAFVQMRSTLARNEVELRHSEALAQEANRAKTTFLAAMSHEIRTPMIGVTGMLELLAHTGLDPEQRRYVNVIEASSATLLQIIGDILDFSKIEAGRLELALEPVDLRRLVDGIIDNFLGVASSRGLYLTRRIDDDVAATLLADPLRLRQILSNLIANALKFTHKGGVHVAVELLQADASTQTLALRVQDTGIGIAPEQQDKLFTPFAQAEAGIARNYGGTGLGLTICERLGKLMGGRLTLQSQLGEGTSAALEVTLSISDATPIAQEIRRNAPIELPRRAAPDVEAAVRERSLILLVDDHPTNREVVSRQLDRAGYTSITANDGEEALQIWRTGQFALVLADIHMPRMDGYGLVAAIRAVERKEGRARIPVIALTANVTKGEAERCLAAGMDDFLGKPVSIGQLAGKLRQWLPHVRFDSAAAAVGVEAAAAAVAATEPFDTGATAASPVDLSVLDDIASGDAEVVDSLLADFIDAALRDLVALDGALLAGDLDTAAREAHRIKGAARILGATVVASAAATIEECGRDNQPIAAADVERLHSGVAQLHQWMTQRRAAAAARG